MRWLLLALMPLPALAEITVDGNPPREHGWWIGDELVQRVRIGLPDGVTLDPASLPRPRAVDYWLDLREIHSHPTDGGIELVLHWQNFYAALEPRLREVPPSPLLFSDGTRAMLPGFDFVSSPMRPILAPSSPDQLLPDARYRLVGPAANRMGLGLALVSLIISLGLLTRHQGWWPFHTRAARPFTRAARRISAMKGAGAASLRKELHRGFDAANGRVLIGAQLDDFLARRPEFGGLSDRLRDFFTRSDAAFYGVSAQDGDPVEIRALSRDLAGVERGRR